MIFSPEAVASGVSFGNINSKYVYRFFTIFRSYLVKYRYTVDEVRETDAAEISADNPTVYL